MKKGLLFLVVFGFCWITSPAQKDVNARMVARSNVESYDDEAGIAKSAYRESPYFMEFTGRWNQKQTDSSIVYSREIDVGKFWKDYRVSLNVRCGRTCRVSLNGKTVGYGGDSRHWNEFEINSFLKYGKKNTLVIEALKHSDEALLESEEQEVGLNGEPYLLFKGDPNVADMVLMADYEPMTSLGTLSLDVTAFNSKKKGKYYLDVEIWDPKGHTFDRMGRWVVFDKKSEVSVDLNRTWSGVEPWTAETPNLYTLVVRLRNEEMEEEELVGARFGFRRVEVKDGLLLLNGKPITLKGVTYGLKHIEGLAGRERIRQDLLTMKQNNINAVRTSKFSPMDPYFYQLCDEMGLYVVCDANLLPSSTQQHVVATDKDFIPMFERRVENLYGKYKNHPSIVAWSLGESRDNGICMAAAYKRLKQLDISRPVVFSGAEHTENTDVIALVRPTAQTLRLSLEKTGDRPYLMFASVGEDNFSSLGNLWEMVTTYRNLQGGFVDQWPLNGTKLADLKDLYSPFDVHLSKTTIDDAEFLVFNRNDFSNFSNYILEYTIFTNLRPNITAGDLPLAIEGGGVEMSKLRMPPVTLQPGEEIFVRFDLQRRKASSTDKTVGSVVFPLPYKLTQKKMLTVDDHTLLATFETLDGRERCRVHTLTNELAFNLADGTLEWFTSGLGQMPIDSLTLFFENHRNWNRSLVAIAHTQPAPGIYVVDAMLRYHSLEGSLMCDVRQTYTVFATGDMVVDYTIAPSDHLRETLVPRVEIAHSFGENDTLSWFGLDRETPYGQRRSAIPGTYRETLPHSMIRDENRWCAINDSAYKGLFVNVPDTHFTFMASTHVLRITPAIANPSKPSFRLHLRGFSPKVFNISSTYINEEQFAKQNQGGERIEDFIGTTYPQVSTGMLEPPVITATEARFSAPLTVTITSPSNGEIRYTLDGSDPDENSPLYSAPFTLTTTTVVKARVFGKGVPPSFTATRKFNYDYIVKTSFSKKPNTPFNDGTDTLLFDGEKALVNDLSKGWLGFSGDGVTTTVELSKPIDIELVTLRYAHVPDMWAFAPQKVTVVFSSDGELYSDTLQVPIPFDPALAEFNNPQVVELRIPVDKSGINFLKIEAQSISAVPSWHRAKGLNPWLLMDEIEVSEAALKNE